MSMKNLPKNDILQNKNDFLSQTDIAIQKRDPSLPKDNNKRENSNEHNHNNSCHQKTKSDSVPNDFKKLSLLKSNIDMKYRMRLDTNGSDVISNIKTFRNKYTSPYSQKETVKSFNKMKESVKTKGVPEKNSNFERSGSDKLINKPDIPVTNKEVSITPAHKNLKHDLTTPTFNFFSPLGVPMKKKTPRSRSEDTSFQSLNTSVKISTHELTFTDSNKDNTTKSMNSTKGKQKNLAKAGKNPLSNRGQTPSKTGSAINLTARSKAQTLPDPKNFDLKTALHAEISIFMNEIERFNSEIANNRGKVKAPQFNFISPVTSACKNFLKPPKSIPKPQNQQIYLLVGCFLTQLLFFFFFQLLLIIFIIINPYEKFQIYVHCQYCK